VLAAPLAVALALVGFALGGTGRWLRQVDPWAPAAAVATYATYAAPIVLSGKATFAGYIKLDDTATYLAMLDQVESRGRDFSGLAPSTYEATLKTSLIYGYPTGSFAPLGAMHRLLVVDTAWLWQPYLAFIAALLALALYALSSSLIPSRPLRALTSFVAAQPAILFGYYLWGGIKELATALLLVLLAASVLPVLERPAVRSVVPLAVTTAAVVGVLSLGGAVWLALLAPAVVLVAFRAGLAGAIRAAAAFCVIGAVLAIPSFVAAADWLPRSGAFTSEGELGNLVGRLRWIQVAGIWPIGDFRYSPGDMAPVYVLIAVVFVAAAAAVAWTWSVRAWAPLLYAAGALVGAVVLPVFASPWVGGKALAAASPAFIAFALAAAAAIYLRGRRVEAGVLALAVIGGVAWSNVAAYRDVWLAPRDRLAELEHIGKRYAGTGPTLMTEFEPYGARHFLRKLDAEGTSELRRRIVPLRSGSPLEPQGYADLDRFDLGNLFVYRTLVLRRSPVASVPPSAYGLVDDRHWYSVWQQRRQPPRILQHLPLGTELDPAAVPPCNDVLRLAGLSGASHLVTVPRAPVRNVPLSALALPRGWTAGYLPGSVDPKRTGSVRTSIELPSAGRWTIWIGGAFVGRVSASVDGQTVGDARHQLEWTGQFVELGTVPLGRGTHRIALNYELGRFRPGSHGLAPFPLGPLVIAPVESPRAIVVPVSEARSLCGRRLDWIEAVS
jgi:hypothetical protein